MQKSTVFRLIALLLALWILICSVGCDRARVPEQGGLSSGGAVSASVSEGKGVLRFRYTYSEQEETALREQLAALRELVEQGEDYDRFAQLEQRFEEAYVHLSTQSAISNLYHYLDLNSAEANDRFLYSSALKSEMGRELILLYREVYDSSFQEAFFADWSEEDIAWMLESAETYTESVLAAIDDYNALCVEYAGLDSESDGYSERVAALYSRQIALLNGLAREMGYDQFYEYAYPNEYDRDYSAAEVERFRTLCGTYLPDIIQRLLMDLQERSEKLSEEDLEPLEQLLFGSSSPEEMIEAGRYFYSRIGGANEQAYLQLLSEENYLFAYGKESFKGAFTSYLSEYETPIIYFGPEYHNLLTFLHESGHYCAFVLSEAEEDITSAQTAEAAEDAAASNDLLEIHSQGSEWLYLSMLSGSYSEELYRYLVEYRLYTDLVQVLVCTAVDAFEERCYREEPPAEEMDRIMREVCDELCGYSFLSSLMGITPLAYWRLVVIENPVYYISYPVSLLPSIELFLHADKDLQTAIGEYCLLFGADRKAFLDTLSLAGLSTPFEATFFELLQDYLDQLLA